jgi:hypothetical protein
VTVTKQGFDWHHAAIITLFAFGVIRGALPMFLTALHGGGHLDGGQILVGVGSIIVAAAFAFVKTPPGTLLAALEQGQALGEGKQP